MKNSPEYPMTDWWTDRLDEWLAWWAALAPEQLALLALPFVVAGLAFLADAGRRRFSRG